MWMRNPIPTLVLVGALASCGDGAAGDASKTEKDRGEAAMQLGDRPWSAERTTAKLRDGSFRAPLAK